MDKVTQLEGGKATTGKQGFLFQKDISVVDSAVFGVRKIPDSSPISNTSIVTLSKSLKPSQSLSFPIYKMEVEIIPHYSILRIK